MITKRLSQLMVLGALFGAIIMAVSHALDKGVAISVKVAFVMVMACVALGEFLAWHNAASGWHERRAGSMLLWAVLGGVLTAGVAYTNFSVTAGNNDTKAGIQQTAFVTQEDLGSTERELSRAVEHLEQKLRLIPIGTPEAARARIDRAKADRLWQYTSGCKEARGPQSRAFCDGYASAVADESTAMNALTLREELKLKQAELRAVRERRSTDRSVISNDQPHILVLASTLSVDQSRARTIDSMVIPLMTQAMLLLGGILTANEAHRGRPPAPWFDRAKWRRRRDLLLGWRPEAPPVAAVSSPARTGLDVTQTKPDTQVIRTTITDRAWAEAWEAALRQSRLSPA